MAVKKKTGGNAAYDTFRGDLAAGTLGTVYIFYGEESYLREFYLSELRKKLVPAGFEEFNYHRLEGKSLTVQSLTEAAEAMPMMAERTMIQVTDWDVYKLPEDQRNALIALLEDFPDYCCLVLVYDQIEYKPNKTYKKLYAALDKRAQAVEFREQSQGEILKWVSRRFKATGHTIDVPTAEHLIFTCGSLMNGLIPEIGKIAAYARGERITKADVDAVAAPVLEAIALDTGRDKFWLMERWNMRSDYPARLLLDNAKRVSRQWCANAVRRCYETDLRIKSVAGVDGADELKLLLMELAQEGRR